MKRTQDLRPLPRMKRRIKTANAVLDENKLAADVILFYKIKRRSSRGYVQVTSPEGKVYHVYPLDVIGPTCTCPDFAFRRMLKPEGCKHIIAVKALYCFSP